MTYNALGPGALDYLPCRYGTSKLLFRGPGRNLDDPYIAFIGGTETYGRFVEKPFPALIEVATGMPCVNFGCMNAGLDVFARDPFVLGAAAEAQISVLQIMGAQNMTNRFYSVHPRRNDRFLAPSDLLKTIYRDIDFSEFHFSKHMLAALKAASADRFKTVHRELQTAWVARMRLLMGQISGKIILLWFADHAPDRHGRAHRGLGADPLFISQEMIDQVAAHAAKVVKVVPSRDAYDEGTNGMVFAPLEAHIAAELPGSRAHREVAAALLPAIQDVS